MSDTNQATQTFVVGVGVSAGGLEAFQELLEHLKSWNRLAIIFVLVDASSKSLLSELRDASTEMPIVELVGRQKLKPGHVYIAPAKECLEVKNGAVRAVGLSAEHRQMGAIDYLFHELAADQGSLAVGVVLSGAGSDGTEGLKAISDAGGLTFAQDAMSAKFDSMPRNAATTGLADHVCRPSEIAAKLIRYADHLAEFGGEDSVKKVYKQIGEAIPSITEHLLSVTGHNFRNYKITTLVQRIQRRMRILQLASAREYLVQLQDDDDEVLALLRELRIGVTAFFRDTEAVDALNATVLPSVFDSMTTNDVVRIWVAGCSTGEEAYSMAILCDEYCGQIENPPDFQILATDIDERALQVARTGIYPSGMVEHVSTQRLKTYFVKRGNRYQVTKSIREHVLFSKHNLMSDPPFSRQDIIFCQNLLMYMGAHLQEKLIPLFHHALRPTGFLFLGPSETISSHGELFRALDTSFEFRSERELRRDRSVLLA